MNYVYFILSPSGRRYVGSTSNFRARRNMHLWRMRSGTHENVRVQREFNKYGPLEVVAVACALPGVPVHTLEQQCLDEARAEGVQLNIGPVAASPRRGVPLTPEQRAKLSDARRGVPLSPEKLTRRRELMKDKPNPMQGREHSEETKRKISERLKAGYAAGRAPSKHSPSREHLERQAKRMRETPLRQGVGKPLRGTKDGEVRLWPTTIACARDIGCDLSYPSQRVNTGKLCKGWLLEYV